MARRKKTSLGKFKNMTSEDIKHLKAKEAQKLLKDVRELYQKRAASLEARIERAKRQRVVNGETVKNKMFYSPAYENTGIINKKGERTQTGIKLWYEKKMAEGKISDPYSTKIADAKAELSRLHDFFNAKTSTARGAEKVMQAQDARIFGVDSKGKPLDTLSREERDFFWSVYNEFKSSDLYSSTFWSNYQKNKVEETLGKIMVGKRGQTTHAELSQMLEELKNALDDDHYVYNSLTSITGDGSDFN